MIGNTLRSKCDKCGNKANYLATGFGAYKCCCPCHKKGK